jgi:hypothetical protein
MHDAIEQHGRGRSATGPAILEHVIAEERKFRRATIVLEAKPRWAPRPPIALEVTEKPVDELRALGICTVYRYRTAREAHGAAEFAHSITIAP